MTAWQDRSPPFWRQQLRWQRTVGANPIAAIVLVVLALCLAAHLIGRWL